MKETAMASGAGFDHHSGDYWSQPRGFMTPPPSWKTNRCFPAAATRSEKKPRRTPDAKNDLFHVIHKIPSGDSPYVRAKHVQLVDKDPSRAVSLFWAAINSGDRVDSALKDMAVVMKQLDRSDEAIEAIKSFRHLSSPESQESLDNILLELYKQSGRFEEEIEMLQQKVKQVEEGLAFSGKRTKIARSQGKKVQVPIEKEYSRLLGNLAWAYMQQKDFKSAEEHYRKALSFESDRNKQCNLAICLMHMNKLTEAKFLLQTVRFSFGKGNVDESYSKSYDRAAEILAEFESQKQMQPYVKANNAPFTALPHEKRANFDWRKPPLIGQDTAHNMLPVHHPNIPKVPLTQPRHSGGQHFSENAYGNYCRKLSFEPSPAVPAKPLQVDDEKENNARVFQFPTSGHVKSWADMVEEEEQEYENRTNNENLDTNIIHSTPPKLHDQAEKLCLTIGSIDLGSGYLTQPEKAMNQPVRRSLCFDQKDSEVTKDNLTSPMATKVLDFEGQDGEMLSENLSSGKSKKRLQVFQDITSPTASP